MIALTAVSSALFLFNGPSLSPVIAQMPLMVQMTQHFLSWSTNPTEIIDFKKKNPTSIEKLIEKIKFLKGWLLPVYMRFML